MKVYRVNRAWKLKCKTDVLRTLYFSVQFNLIDEERMVQRKRAVRRIKGYVNWRKEKIGEDRRRIRTKNKMWKDVITPCRLETYRPNNRFDSIPTEKIGYVKIFLALSFCLLAQSQDDTMENMFLYYKEWKQQNVTAGTKEKRIGRNRIYFEGWEKVIA